MYVYFKRSYVLFIFNEELGLLKSYNSSIVVTYHNIYLRDVNNLSMRYTNNKLKAIYFKEIILKFLKSRMINWKLFTLKEQLYSINQSINVLKSFIYIFDNKTTIDMQESSKM